MRYISKQKIILDEKSFNWFYKDLTKLGITRLEIIKNGIKQHFE